MNRTRVTGLIAACVFAVVSAVAAPAFAQMGSLKGKVVDAQGQPVADAGRGLCLRAVQLLPHRAAGA